MAPLSKLVILTSVLAATSVTAAPTSNPVEPSLIQRATEQPKIDIQENPVEPLGNLEERTVRLVPRINPTNQCTIM